MKFFQIISLCILFAGSNFKLIAQDPNFSQPASSPMSISPALTSNGESALRLMSNFRSQWFGIGSPYNTYSVAVDGKLYSKLDNDYFLSLGGMIIQDVAMNGVYKSTYVNINTSYHLTLDGRGNGLTLGLGAIYNRTRIDATQLTFDYQLSSSGFSNIMPSAEPYFNNKENSFSMCAGLMYTHTTDAVSFDLGVAGYRFLTTKRTVLGDASQFDNPRYDIHSNFETSLSDYLTFNASLLHTMKAGDRNTMVGAILGITNQSLELDNAFKFFNIGAYYRVGKTIIPYVGYDYNNLQFGLTYDVDMSSGSSSSIPLKSVELSIFWRKLLDPLSSRAGKFHSPL